MTKRRLFRGLALLLLALGQGWGLAQAQTFPDKPVRIVVPFPPGGGIDVLIRAVAAELTVRWKQPVVVENRAGGGGIIGGDAVAKAAPDGHTLLATVNQVVTTNRYLYRKLPYDPDKSFVPVSLMVRGDHFLLAHPSAPFSNVKELVAYARANPGKVGFGSFGAGTQPHLAYATLAAVEHLDLLHVPYKGIAPLMQAVVAGEVMVGTGSASVAGELIRAGRVKPLGFASAQRAGQFPDVPTTAEQGYPQVQASIWYALLAPAGTPRAVVDRITQDVNQILRQPAFAAAQVTARGLDLVAGDGAALAAAIEQDVAASGVMIRFANVQPE